MELALNENFGRLADKETINKTIENLAKNNIKAMFAENRAEAKRILFEQIPKNSEVMNMTSTTLETIGAAEEILSSSSYLPIRKMFEVEKDELIKRRLGAAQDYAVGSVHAVTQEGEVLIASYSGSQIPAYAYGAFHVIWVVGAQKIVKDVEEGMRRLYEYSLPLENERARKAYGIGSAINKILIFNKEFSAGRVTMIIVDEKLGF